MDLLKRELERKKQALAKNKQPGTKWRKAVELRRQLDVEESEDKPDEGAGTKSRLEASADVETPETKSEETPRASKQVDDKDIKRKLRSMGLPVLLFGESSAERLERYEQAQQSNLQRNLQESEANEFRLGQGHDVRNPFLVKGKDETLPVEDRKQSKKRKLEEDTDDPYKKVYRHFKNLLLQWEEDLEKRPEDVRRTIKGQNETKTLKQCKDYIRPLFKELKSRQIDPNMLKKLVQIVDFAKIGEFVKAHDAYLDVAIGRAAWPIGVTMVGIHARTGRAKIESQNVAHVMNSELSRKYLTSVKRLLTYHQSKFEGLDPSKKVM